MISVEDALNKILSFIDVLNPEEKPILDCPGQVLAEDIISNINVPPLNNSAMDGFAVRAEDTLTLEALSGSAANIYTVDVKFLNIDAAGDPISIDVAPVGELDAATGSALGTVVTNFALADFDIIDSNRNLVEAADYTVGTAPVVPSDNRPPELQ